ncbi:type II toxin-antitoxin system VapC family toxin [Agrobacterium larrymoorei]|uniref:Ribonuclease VapC n=1 Tax=Agrobacterium larrymoorei TaxID=160699 RepID=A0A4D7DYL3_9HYPH|nr:type II toxin-antitoxin system VapC family toxin [Agrobacterium larrymoorei]QCJ00315.1 PIN domain-containing protein [Agrobacterium larrymoorei]QYA09239.1 type II toxin-antitoxin system VapC family toxin [Agrobacterium larrymoorei]
MSFVVDASVVAAWFLPDEANELAEKALQRLESEDAFAPDLLAHELRNILVMAERRKRIEPEDVLSILLRFNSLPITLVSGDDAVSIVKLARQHALSAYDAAYLALSIGRSMPLATMDKKLVAAAKAENVAFA